MSTIKTVALAGASGSIGTAVLSALLDANFTVTALTRSDSSHSFPSGVKVAKIDYDDMQSMKAALEGQDALISTVGYAAILPQKELFEAAITSGVKRILPSEYGADPEVPAARYLPVFGHKVQVEQFLKEKIQGTSTSYTLVCNNEFFDWDLDNNFGVDIKAKKMEIFDGGNVTFTATPLDFVARGVVGVLQHPDETANRVVRVHGIPMTQNKILELVQRYTGKERWDITHSNLAERAKQGYEMLQKDPADFVPWAMAFLQCATFGGKDYGGDFSAKNDNELLGLKELSDAEIEEIVSKRC